ncbi:MAG: endonuclease [Thermoplasmata archaeon]|nr:MAG: endonuclease [Thermoplasmata archaeon]
MNKKLFIIALCLVLLVWGGSAGARTFKVATYNVQNLFDLVLGGTEYDEYVPNSRMGWNRQTAAVKYRNIARVINDLEPDILALQEVESRRALVSLRDSVKKKGLSFPYLAIADKRPSAVKCALLSRFPILSKREIPVSEEMSRNILAVTIKIDGSPLLLFVNHWKSKRGPESLRLPYARALRKAIDNVPFGTDFIVLGDLNSNYNEWTTFRAQDRLNDTHGRTGINHILGTILGMQMVTEETLLKQKKRRLLYNLWLELKPTKRWSYNFFGLKGSPDNMIIPEGLYDNTGVSYVDNSFGRFTRRYLFRKRAIFQWQRARNGKGKHLGMGFSDHLPIFALFSTHAQLCHRKAGKSQRNDILFTHLPP